jgi:ORF6N domain
MTAIQPLIQNRILWLREQRVMLDADLAQLYGVETRVLVEAVKRNAGRFPADFMFQLSADEVAILRSQFVISSASHGGRRSAP